MTDDLVTWLRQQLNDDEEVASDAAGPSASRRRWMRDAISCVVDATDNGLIVYGEGTPTSEQADHIVRWDPARVLAEVDAKRRILDEVVPDLNRLDGLMETQERGGWHEDSDKLTRLLALPYADRPGYQEDWRP